MRTTRIKRLLALILALAGLPGAFSIASGQPARDQDPTIPVIEMQTVQLTMAIANLARQAGLNYILDPKLTDPAHGPDGKNVPPLSVSFRWENLTAKQALTRLLGEHGLCAVESSISSVTRITFTNQIANVVDKAWVISGTNTVIPLIQMQDASLDTALTHIVKKAQLDVVLDSKLSNPSFVPGKPFVPRPTVSIRWENVTARQAIAALCENYGLVMTKDAATGTVRISAKAPAGREAVAPEKVKASR